MSESSLSTIELIPSTETSRLVRREDRPKEFNSSDTFERLELIFSKLSRVLLIWVLLDANVSSIISEEELIALIADVKTLIDSLISSWVCLFKTFDEKIDLRIQSKKFGIKYFLLNKKVKRV